MSVYVLSLFLAVTVSVAHAGIESPLYLERIADYSKTDADLFVVPILVGNPASAFNLTIDIAYYEAALIGAGSTKGACTDSSHRGFDASRSTTFRKTSSKPYTMSLNAYMAGQQCKAKPEAKVTVGQDDFLGAKNVPFGVISKFRGSWSPEWASDGVLGLNGPDGGLPQQPSTVKTLLSQLDDDPVVALYLDQNRVVGEEVGKIAFGSVPDLCGDVKYPDAYFSDSAGTIDRARGWNFRVNDAKLGDSMVGNLGGKGFLDISNSILLQMPSFPMSDGVKSTAFEDFMDEIDATKDEATGLFYVDCNDASSLPNLTVWFDGQQYQPEVSLTFPYNAYIDSVGQDGKCEVLLRSDPATEDDFLGNLFWTFGNRLLEYYCVVLNYDTGYVGFAELNH